MNAVLPLLLILVVRISTVGSQGARGGGGSRSGSRSGYRGSRYRGNSCYGPECHKTGIITGAVIGGVFLLVAVAFLIVYFYRRHRRSQVSESNIAFASKTQSDGENRGYQTYEEDYFRSGLWECRYHQYGKWHGPQKMSLMFDRATKQIAGHGSDDIGKFNITGTFSIDDRRIALIKTYEPGTGDLKENFGHTVTVCLVLDPIRGQFEGTWSVRTPHYNDEDKFQLKLTFTN